MGGSSFHCLMALGGTKTVFGTVVVGVAGRDLDADDLEAAVVCWKANVRKTISNQLTIWPRRWSFLVREYEKMHEAMEGKRLLSPYTGIATWPRWHGSHAESTTKQEEPEKKEPEIKKPEKKTKKREVEELQLPPIKAVPARKRNLPRTTSGWYGYTHLHNGHNLVSDRQRWTKAQAYQHDLIKLLKWPMDYYD